MSDLHSKELMLRMKRKGLSNVLIADILDLSREAVRLVVGPDTRSKPPAVPNVLKEPEKLPEALRAWRTYHGITQGEAAKLLIATQTQISFAEAGKRLPKGLSERAAQHMRITNHMQLQLDRLTELNDSLEKRLEKRKAA